MYQWLIEPSLTLAIGFLAHWIFFIRGEWHLKAPTVVIIHFMVAFLVLMRKAIELDSHLQAAAQTTVMCGGYLVGLFASIICYRLCFHRLRAFPGPKMAAMTKLWHVWKCRDSRNHLVMEELHETYGQFVRTGPNEITIFHPAAHHTMLDSKLDMHRTDWYDLLVPRRSSIFTRDSRLHTIRRRIWSRALNAESMGAYEPRILSKINELVDRINTSNGEAVEVNDLVSFFAFDLMGSFAFNQDFGMMRNNNYHSAVRMILSALELMGPFGPAIWICRLGFAFIPFLWKVKDWFDMLKFCDECTDRRMQIPTKERDIASWFIEDAKRGGPSEESLPWLGGDTATLVVAGSGTTAPTLVAVLYYLATHPANADIIHKEVAGIDLTNHGAIKAAPHLSGTINEAMRLLPAVLTFQYRMTPPGGLLFEDGTFIPGCTNLAAPRWIIGRLESAFERPNEFIPERWYSRPELVKDPRAFAPFGIGRTACVGKNLALTEIRFTIARLVRDYLIKLEPDDNASSVIDDLRDQLTASPGRLRLIFELRRESVNTVQQQQSF